MKNKNLFTQRELNTLRRIISVDIREIYDDPYGFGIEDVKEERDNLSSICKKLGFNFNGSVRLLCTIDEINRIEKICKGDWENE